MAGAFVLDAFALLALFQDEPGAPRVQKLIQEAQETRTAVSMTSVNLGEVVYGLEGRRGRSAVLRALGAIAASPIEIVEVDQSLALDAARLTASSGMGYLDCFVAALAQRRDAIAVTGDPDFRKVEAVVAIEWLPR